MSERHEQEMMEPTPVQYSRFDAVELMCVPTRYDQGPRRDWKKSQKKIRRERRQRGGRK